MHFDEFQFHSAGTIFSMNSKNLMTLLCHWNSFSIKFRGTHNYTGQLIPLYLVILQKVFCQQNVCGAHLQENYLANIQQLNHCPLEFSISLVLTISIIWPDSFKIKAQLISLCSFPTLPTMIFITGASLIYCTYIQYLPNSETPDSNRSC